MWLFVVYVAKYVEWNWKDKTQDTTWAKKVVFFWLEHHAFLTYEHYVQPEIFVYGKDTRYFLRDNLIFKLINCWSLFPERSFRKVISIDSFYIQLFFYTC